MRFLSWKFCDDNETEEPYRKRSETRGWENPHFLVSLILDSSRVILDCSENLESNDYIWNLLDMKTVRY